MAGSECKYMWLDLGKHIQLDQSSPVFWLETPVLLLVGNFPFLDPLLYKFPERRKVLDGDEDEDEEARPLLLPGVPDTDGVPRVGGPQVQVVRALGSRG